MEKNTIWAISLSTVVLVGFFAAQTLLFPNRSSGAQPAKQQEAAVAEKTVVQDNFVSPAILEDAESLPEAVAEENFVISTNKVKVTFTNRGGDIIGFEILDKDPKKAAEMADNITEKNRAFAIALGGADNSIVNDIFTAKKIDDYTIGFFKKFSVKNSSGEPTSFTLVKTYYFKPNDYLFKLDVTVDGGENFTGLDFNGLAYSLRTSPQIAPTYNPKDRYDIREFIAFDGEKKFKPKAKGNERSWVWTSVASKYFEILVNPFDSVAVAKNLKLVSPEKSGTKDSQIVLSRSAFGQSRVSDSYYIYVGPRSEKELNKYSSSSKNEWGIESTHYNESLPTSGILSWVEIVLKFIMELTYKLIPNWGVSIIILTVLLKLALYPLTKKSLMGTQKMAQMQPKMQALQAKYKGNPAKLQEETAKLYKESGYNPMAGCLPLIIQFIILWSMYHLFNNYYEFRGASFIPGWIPDLSTSDHVYELKFSIIGLGNEIHILPVIYLISQLLFGKITQNGGTAAGQNATQMKIMMYGMPIVFFFIFYRAPSGLLLYWTVSNIIQLLQQLLINRYMKKKAPAKIEKKTKK